MLGKAAVYISEEDRDYLKYVKGIASTLGLMPDFLYLEGEEYLLSGILGFFGGPSEERQASIRKYIDELFEGYQFYILTDKDEGTLSHLQDNYDLLFVKYKKQLFIKSIPEWLISATDNLRIWIYKEEAKASIKRVCLPVDFSERSIKQVEFTDFLKRYFNFEYELVYAMNTKRFLNKISKRDYERSLSDKREEVMYMYTDIFGGRDINLVLIEGDPYREMVKYINSSHYDLVVIGRRGRGMRERIGSVSLHMARSIKCPLIVL